jgi:hypothetical protein
MKWATALLLAFAVRGADLSEVRTVYLFPIAGGLDQHLANRLTNAHLFQVVTDPKRAEAVFTDRIGEPLEERLKDLFPEPQPEIKEKDEEDEPEKTPAKDFKVMNKSSGWSSFGGGKGTLFLVDAKSRQVLWSVFEKPKNSTTEQLNRTAERIVNRLKKDLSGGK